MAQVDSNTNKYTSQAPFLVREKRRHQPQPAQATLRKRMNRSREGFGNPSMNRKNWKEHNLGAQRNTARLVTKHFLGIFRGSGLTTMIESSIVGLRPILWYMGTKIRQPAQNNEQRPDISDGHQLQQNILTEAKEKIWIIHQLRCVAGRSIKQLSEVVDIDAWAN
jgi:hypothetical protein